MQLAICDTLELVDFVSLHATGVQRMPRPKTLVAVDLVHPDRLVFPPGHDQRNDFRSSLHIVLSSDNGFE